MGVGYHGGNLNDKNNDYIEDVGYHGDKNNDYIESL